MKMVLKKILFDAHIDSVFMLNFLIPANRVDQSVIEAAYDHEMTAAGKS